VIPTKSTKVIANIILATDILPPCFSLLLEGVRKGRVTEAYRQQIVFASQSVSAVLRLNKLCYFAVCICNIHDLK
jgi:hypothetical protein